MLKLLMMPVMFTGGWIFNLIVDIQFGLGFVAGWLAKQGWDDLSDWVLNLTS